MKLWKYLALWLALSTITNLRLENNWPAELKILVALARKVKERYGFHIETFSLKDWTGK